MKETLQRRGTTGRGPTEVMLTVDEVAEWLGVARGFVYRLIHERRIEFVKVGRHVRIAESVVRDFISAGTVQPTPRRAGRVV